MRLSPLVMEWLNLLARWTHVFAAILWVGTTYYFTWLDARLSEAERDAREGAGSTARGGAGAEAHAADDAQVWMVHSGGFYVVDKRKRPGTRPLHWFRWEAALTWLSGLVLLVVVYYMGGGMVDADVRELSTGAAVGVGVATLVAGWVVYDLMCFSPLARSEALFAAVGYALVVGVVYALTHLLAGRAAYLHVGAMFGTIMAANVWMRILPAQRRMIAATKEGRQPDLALAARAKLRSKHNTFLVVPAVFTMISNHFPVATRGYSWVVLCVLILAGWVAAHFIRRA